MASSGSQPAPKKRRLYDDANVNRMVSDLRSLGSVGIGLEGDLKDATALFEADRSDDNFRNMKTAEAALEANKWAILEIVAVLGVDMALPSE